MNGERGLSRRLISGMVCAVALLLTACGGGSGGGASTTPLAISVSEPDADGVVTINVSGLPAGDLPESAFKVIESGEGKPGEERPIVSVEKISEDTRANADIAFVFDTTSSMRNALDSVKASIGAFVDHLDGKGLDVQVGTVTFGDAFDTRSASGSSLGVSLGGHVPPAFDTQERPTYALSADFPAFKAFLAQLQPLGGGRSPENALGALAFAYDNLAWRTGAQRILIVVMDLCSHNADTYGMDNITAPWIPTTIASVMTRLKGQAIVHVISPTNGLLSCVTESPATYTDMAAFTGAAGTGGVHVDWNGGTFDLTALPITQAVTGGYLIKYVTGTHGKRTVRVIVDDGGANRGEATATVG